MRKYAVRFRPEAEADLLGLYEFIAERSGVDVAGGYIDRVEAACAALSAFPNRGTKRDDLRHGLRTIGFERRATIAFLVAATEVVIVNIFYGGQDFERTLREPD
jgi:toxin ParE1/3/4